MAELRSLSFEDMEAREDGFMIKFTGAKQRKENEESQMYISSFIFNIKSQC